MTRLRIGLVHPFSWPEVRRGGERYLDDLTWYLAAAGHDIEVITGTDGDPAVTEVHGARVRKLRHRVPGPLARHNVGAIDTFGAVAYPVLLRHRYDVVHAFTPTAALAARLAGQRTVYTVLGHPTSDQFRARPYYRRQIGLAVRTADVAAALSRASAGAVETLFGRRPVVLPPGVRLDRFPLAPAPRTGSPRILFSAALDNPVKGLDVLAAAFPLLRHDGSRLVLSGPGDHTWALDDGRVAYDALGTGALDDVPDRYRAATVTALPSRNEAFGLALVESLASGTPVVCGDDGGPPEIVDDPRTGRVVPCRDERALANAIDAMIDAASDPDTPARCRERAARWDWAGAVGPAHERLYAFVASPRPR